MQGLTAIASFAQVWASAPRGKKNNVLAEAEQALGMSRQTLYRKFKDITESFNPRKRRSDAGQVALSREDALRICAVIREHIRKNGKRQQSIKQTIAILRESGLIDANRIDKETGEIMPLSLSAIINALKHYNLHPDDLEKPAPAITLRSLHPNHVWQIDPSLSTMYYLVKEGLNQSQVYKNKPNAMIKALRETLWRYVITDHISGAIYVEYVTGGETAENITNVFMNCMQQRKNQGMYGVPKIIMLDPGSANTSHMLKTLCQNMQIRVQINEPGNPRAKGSVEKANDLVERNFESMLKTVDRSLIQSLEQINTFAAEWCAYFNSHFSHSRHGMTRYEAWSRITSDQLVLAPPSEVMKQLAITKPEERKVSTFLTVSYKGVDYDASYVPGINVGEKILVCRAPTSDNCLKAIGMDENGREVYHVLPQKHKDDFGQYIDGPVIGESFKSHTKTTVQHNADEVEMLATNTSTVEEAKAARKAKKTGLFGGAYDPFAVMANATPVIPLPRQGREHELSNQEVKRVIEPPLTHIKAAKELKERIADWSPAHYKWMVEHYPDGVPADGLVQLVHELEVSMGNKVIQLRRAS